MNRRDLLLQEMNIPQWVLAKPQVLKGDAQIRLAPNVKLVVVSEENRQTSGLFQDILRSLQLPASDYFYGDLEQSLRLDFNHQPIFWLIMAEDQAVRFRQKFADHTIWHTQSWQDLAQSNQKHQLWQQMQPFCQHFEEKQ